MMPRVVFPWNRSHFRIDQWRGSASWDLLERVVLWLGLDSKKQQGCQDMTDMTKRGVGKGCFMAKARQQEAAGKLGVT